MGRAPRVGFWFQWGTSPIQIIRYSNRIEIRNVGHSLKPVAELGIPSSRLRNPTLAAVLHDLNLAEAKGTGIRSMRRLAAEAGLTLPEVSSSRESDEFRVTLFLHNLLTEDDHAWLRSLSTEAITSPTVMPADGPSLGTPAAGKWMWMS